MSKEIKTGLKLTLVDDISQKLKKIAENFKKAYSAEVTGAKDMDAGIKKLKSSTKNLESPFKEIINRGKSDFGLGTLTKNLENFKKLGREASITRFYGYNDTIEEFYKLISGGMNEEEAKKSFMQIQKFSKATRSDLENTTKAIMTARNVEKVGTNEASDVFTKTQYKYSLKNLNQLMEGYKQVASVAKNVAHLKFTDTNVALGILNTNGIEGLSVGTALNSILRNLPKLKEAGIAVARYKDGNLNLAKTFSNNLRQKYEALATVEERTKFLQKIFGKEGVKVATIFIAKIDEIKNGIKDVSSSIGLVNKQAKKWQNITLSNNILVLKQSFDNFEQSLGRTVLPMLIKLLNSLTSILNVTVYLMDKFPILGQMAFILATSFVAIKTVKLASTLWNISKALTAVKWGIKGLYSASGLGLVVTAVITIWEYWDKIMKALEKGLNFFKTNLKKFEAGAPKIQDYEKFDLGARGNSNNNVTNHNNITLNVSGAKNPKEFVDTLHKEFEKMQLGYMGGK